MELERTLNVTNIEDKGLIIGTSGNLTLVLKNDSKYYIIDSNGSHLDCLSGVDILSLDSLVELFNEWSLYHQLKTK